MQPSGDANARQQIVERINQSTNILVAVSADPSVDALASALALSLLLNKLDKHATAVFSGETPQAIQFLEPNKTFENNVSSLRDFIISLDREKADRLRYKVENDVVRIFITPYRTTISEKDLQFSQGDFNVELIIALGVEKREDLDKAIIAHGRILHDATVVTINANNQRSSLGSIDWNDANSSSLCEMIHNLSEGLKPGLLDAQISTALLTGVVAATDRFSNQHTTPKVMTMSAQLMAAGANQQLVANNVVPPEPMPQINKTDEEVVGKDGELEIKHTKREEPEESKESKKPEKLEEPEEPKAASEIEQAEAELAKALPKSTSTPAEPTLDQLENSIKEELASSEPRGFVKEAPERAEGVDKPGEKNWRDREIETAGPNAALNLSSEKALEDKNQAEEKERNRKILKHNEVETHPKKVIEPLPEQKVQAQEELADALKMPPLPVSEPEPSLPLELPALPQPEPELAKPEEPAPQISLPPMPPTFTPPPVADLDSARQAVDEALAVQPFTPASQPESRIRSQSLPLEASQDTSAQPFAPTAPPPVPPSVDATVEPNGLPPIPPMPPLPVSEAGVQNLPPMPPSLETIEPNQNPPLPPNAFDPQMPPPASPPADPGQFKIPG